MGKRIHEAVVGRLEAEFAATGCIVRGAVVVAVVAMGNDTERV